MSLEAVEGLRIQITDVLDLTADLTAAQWAAPSGSAGWSVRDVVAHMGSGFKMFIDPTELAEAPSELTVEQRNEVPVVARRAWSDHQVREEYAEFAPQAIARIESYQAPDLIDVPFPLGDLGTFTLGQIADALCFDHVVHVHCDLLMPSGPLALAASPLAATSLSPTLDWMLAGLPQMCQATITPALTAPLRLVLTGVAGRSVDLIPPTEGAIFITVAAAAQDVRPVAEVTSSVTSFMSWATKRSDWRSNVTVTDGDGDYAASALDALRVI